MHRLGFIWLQKIKKKENWEHILVPEVSSICLHQYLKVLCQCVTQYSTPNRTSHKEQISCLLYSIYPFLIIYICSFVTWIF